MINRIVLSMLSIVIYLSLMAIFAYIPPLSFINFIDKDQIPMAPLTSISFLFTSITLLIFSGFLNNLKQYKKFFIGSVFVIALFGLLEVLGTLAGVDLNFENQIVPSFGELNGIPIARMSLVTGFCFFLSSSILLIMHFYERHSPLYKRLLKVKNVMIVVLLSTSFTFLLADIHGQPLFYDMGKLVPMALSSSFAFLMLTISLIVIDKHCAIHRLFSSESPSSHLIRFIVPFTLIVVVLSGLVENYLIKQSSIYSSALLSSLSLIAILIFSSTLSVKLTRKLTYLHDRDRRYLRRYKHIVDTSSDLFVLLDRNFIYKTVNDSYLKIYNLTSNQIIGRHPREVYGDEYFNLVIKKYGLRALEGESVSLEKYVDFPTKKNVYMSINYKPYYNDDGNIDGFVANGRDISAQKQNTILLEYANLIIDKSSVVLFRWRATEHWPVEYVSSNVSLFGFTPEDFLSGKIRYASIIHPDDLDRVIGEVNYYTETQSESFQHEYRIISATGDIIWLDDRTSIERNDKGDVIYYQGTVIDFTQQKLAQLKLDESNALLSNVINSISDLIFVKNTKLQTILANEAYASVVGKSPDQMIGLNDIENGWDREVVKGNKAKNTLGHEGTDKIALSGGNFQIPNVVEMINGENKIFDIQKGPLKDQGGKVIGVLGLGRDVTERNNYLNKIKFQQQEQLQILDAVFDAIISTDEQGNILTMNQSTSRLFGFTSGEVLGKNINMLLSESTLKRDVVIIQQSLSTDKTTGFGREVVGKHKSNNAFPIRLSVAELPKNESGKRRFIAVCQDLTKIKHQEELFNRSQKMEALGLLTGGLAHDFNNMLAVVIGYSDILKVDLKDQPNPLIYIEQISLAAKRGADLTSKLLAFSRQKPALSRPVNVNELIIENKDLLQKTLPTIALNIELSNELWLTNIEAHSFEDMLLNLAINAMHAMQNGGELSITTKNESLSAAQAINYAITPGDYVAVNVEDNGCGMSADISSKIFEPFFSTKGQQGTGLGLAQVYGFIKSSGGAINVYSEPDKGTRFLIYFPRNTEKYVNERIKTKQTHAELAGSESILVVDDENQLCELAEIILVGHGYKVLTASGGEQALALLKDNHIDLMLSDIIMPKMSGYELAEQVFKLDPNIKILFASGFQGEQVKPTFKSSQPLIDKPYDSQLLLSSIRQCLDENKNADLDASPE